MQQHSTDLVGQLVGHYRILQPIASGGMATVYQAEDIHLQRQVAIKIFRPTQDQSGSFLRRFAREAQVLASLDHPNILLVHDYGEQDGFAYLVMPLMPRGTLKQRLQTRQPLSISEALRLAEQILSALQYAHDHGLVHRDIKPANLLFKTDDSLLLSDFGLVKILAAEPTLTETHLPSAQSILSASFAQPSDTSTLAYAGTPQYMAPEQINGQAIAQSDIYSVGVVLYELLTGTCPFVAERAEAVMAQHLIRVPQPLRAHNQEIPPQLEAAVLRALEKDPQRRYQSASNFLQALRASQKQAPMASDQMIPTSKQDSPVQVASPASLAPNSLAHRAQTNVDLYKTHRVSDPLPPTITQVPAFSLPATPTTSQYRRKVLLFLLLILVVLSGSFGVLAYQHNKAQRSLIPTPIMTASTPGSPPNSAWITHPGQVPQTSCPQDRTARPAVGSPLPLPGTHQNLVYITSTMDPSTTALERYDLAAPGQRQISTIAAVSGPNAAIGSAQIAHDGAWVLFIASNDATTSGEGRDSLQLVRVDGLDQQVLYCSAPQTQMTDLLWSPTQLWAVFSIIDPHTNTVTQYRLHLQDGTVDTLSTTNILSRHIPLIWSTTHASQLYMSTYTTAAGISGPLLGNLVLFNTENSAHQPGLSPLSTISNPGPWHDYALSLDGRTLFLSQCTFAPARGCLAPSTIQVEDVSNPDHPVLTRTIHIGDLAIAHLAVLSETQLVLDVESVGGDTTRDGLWLLHVDGTGQRQLTNSGHLTAMETMLEQHQDSWAYVSRNRTFYCIEDWQGHRLSYGSLSSGNPTPLPVDGAEPVGWIQM